MPRYSYQRADKRIEIPETTDLINKEENNQVKAVIIALYITGARISEVLALTTSDFFIDKKAKEVVIRITTLKTQRKQIKKKGEDGLMHTVYKTYPFSETRHLTLDMNKTPFIQSLLKYRDAAISADSKKLFYVHRSTIWRHIKKINPNLSAHAFRHSRLQKFADASATERQIKAWSGHKSSSALSSYIESSKRLTAPLKEMID